LGLWPEAVPFETAEGAASPALRAIIDGPAAALTAVALVAGTRARASGWATAAAAALARQWPRARRAVLIDIAAAYADPPVHGIEGAPAGDGLADVAAYGLSLRAVRRDIGGCDIVAPGLWLAEPAALLGHALWDRLIAEAAADTLTLLVRLPPLEEPGVIELVRRLGAVIVLAEADEAADLVESLPSPYGVLAVLRPAALPAPADAAGDGHADEPRADASAAAAAAAAEAAAAAAAAAVVAAAAAAADAADAVTGVPAGPLPADQSRVPPPAGRRRLRRGIGWTVALLLALAVLAGAWRVLAGRIGFDGPVDTPAPAAGGAPAPAAGAGAVPAGAAAAAAVTVELPWVVAMEAHTELATAFARLDVLGGEPGTLTFHIVPLERDGSVYYHIMAGPVPDSARAVALRDTLLARRLKTTVVPTDIRHAPLAFLVGEYGDRQNADRSIDELRRRAVPSYRVMTEAPDGYPLYRVYVGGYMSPGEADAMRQRLRAAGVVDSLVTRTGTFYQ
jgi:hypothetical protein